MESTEPGAFANWEVRMDFRAEGGLLLYMAPVRMMLTEDQHTFLVSVWEV